MREYSTPTLVEIPGSANLTDIVFKRAAEAPDTVALRRKVGRGWRDVTAGEFHRDVVATAKGLVAAGIEPGDRVALMSRTRYEWTQIDYAILSAGAVACRSTTRPRPSRWRGSFPTREPRASS